MLLLHGHFEVVQAIFLGSFTFFPQVHSILTQSLSSKSSVKLGNSGNTEREKGG